MHNAYDLLMGKAIIILEIYNKKNYEKKPC